MDGNARPDATGDRSRLNSALRFPALASGLLLAGIMLLTTLDVALRYLANAPLFGAQELTELGMIALIVLAMPYCGATGGHIRVDVLDRALGPTGRLVSDMITGLIGLAILGILVWRTVDKAVDAAEYDDLINMLAIPVWPFYGLIALGFAGYAVVIARDLIVLATPAGRGRDE